MIRQKILQKTRRTIPRLMITAYNKMTMTRQKIAPKTRRMILNQQTTHQLCNLYFAATAGGTNSLLTVPIVFVGDVANCKVSTDVRRTMFE